jgi:hypothetical protein
MDTTGQMTLIRNLRDRFLEKLFVDDKHIFIQKISTKNIFDITGS